MGMNLSDTAALTAAAPLILSVLLAHTVPRPVTSALLTAGSVPSGLAGNNLTFAGSG
jgi:hypothetical protein